MSQPANPFERWRDYESKDRPVKGKREKDDVLIQRKPKRGAPLTREEKLLRAILGDDPDNGDA
ncbi:MAG: hypothetical protein AAFW68_04605 [Pseudomonadota bacterium]